MKAALEPFVAAASRMRTPRAASPTARRRALTIGIISAGAALALAAGGALAVRYGACTTREGLQSGSCQALVHRHGLLSVLVVVAAFSGSAAAWSYRRGDSRPSALALVAVLGASLASLL